MRFQLSDDFKDDLRRRNGGKAVPKDLLRQCARDLFHAQWDIMLGDQDLLQAMEHGTVLMCRDGVERRFFPTFFTYSADYPEK
jgi:Plavaka transposase